MGELAPILLGVVALAGLVSIVMGYKSWPIYTIIIVFFNLVAICGFVYLSARTLKTYQVWHDEVTGVDPKDPKKDGWEKRVQDITKEATGKEEGTGTGDDALSLADLKTQLTKAQAYRPRIWFLLDAETRGTLQGLPPGAAVVANISSAGTTVTADLGWRMQGTPKAFGLEPGKAVYLFGDTLADEKAAGYLGHFKIDAVAPKGLKLTRLEPMMPGEQVMVNNRPVIIYDDFPNDDYRTFAGKSLAELQRLIPGLPNTTYEEFLKHGKPVTAAEEQAMLNQEAIDDQAKNELSTLNKGRVWHRVRVKTAFPVSELSGKVAAPPAPMVDADGNPVPMGEEEQPATFNVGTKIVLDPSTAKQLVDTGKAEYDGNDYRIYMRPLRDYPSEYKRIRENFVDLTAALEEVERLMALNTATEASTNEVIKKHADRTALIKEDLANLKKETAALTAYEAQITQRVKALRGEHDALLKNIGQTAAAITQVQLEALRKANERMAAQDQAAATP